MDPLLLGVGMKDAIIGEGSGIGLTDLVARFAGANLYDDPKAIDNALAEIHRYIVKEDFPRAERAGLAGAEPILEALGETNIAKKGADLRGKVLAQYLAQKDANILALEKKLQADGMIFTAEVRSMFADASRSNEKRDILVANLVKADKEELARIREARKDVEAKQYEVSTLADRIEKNKAAGNDRPELVTRLDEAQTELKKAERNAARRQTFLGRVEGLAQADARDGIRRVAEDAQFAAFKDKGYETFVWIAVNGEKACPSCGQKHGDEKTAAEWVGNAPGDGDTFCGSSCMCHLVPGEYKAVSPGLDRPVRRDDARREAVRVREERKAAKEAEAQASIAGSEPPPGEPEAEKPKDPTQMSGEELVGYMRDLQAEKDAVELQGAKASGASKDEWLDAIAKMDEIANELGPLHAGLGENPTPEAFAAYEKAVEEVANRVEKQRQIADELGLARDAARKAQSDALIAFKEKAWAAVKAPGTSDAAFTNAKDMDPERQRDLSGGLDAFRHLTGARSNGLRSTVQKTRSSRSSQAYGNITLSPHAGENTVVHELGHSLEEFAKDIQAKRQAFYDMRTAGEIPVKLSSVHKGSGYNKIELTRVDRWKNAYTGKTYDTAAYGYRKEWSEVVSMGLQGLHRDPMRFASEDPEFFAWTINLIRGTVP